MLYITFNVYKQKIQRTDTCRVVSDSRNYLHAAFTFSDDDWTGVKTAIFKNGDVVKHAILDDNDECLVPWEVIKPGILHVSVFCGDLITADTATVNINESGYEDGGAPEDPTPTVYEQIISMLNEIETGGIPDDKIAEAVGKYLSENPVETLTEEDVQRIVSEYVAVHKEELKGDKGDKGDPGKPGTNGVTPNLTIGTVETLEAGASATATITGDKENPVLNLGIPKGADGKGDVSVTVISDKDTISLVPDFGDTIINRPIEADAEMSEAYTGKDFSGSVGSKLVKTTDANTVAKVYKVSEGEDIALFGLSCSETNRGWVFIDDEETVISISDKTAWGTITAFKGEVPIGATIAICVNRKAYTGMADDYGAYKPIKYYSVSPLTGKKVVFAGDSYSYGAWASALISTNTLTAKIGSAVAPFENNMLKAYPWHLIRRTGINYVRACTGGNCFMPYDGANRPFMSSSTIAQGQDVQNYTEIPTDTDILVLAFGLNECGNVVGNNLIGQKGDTTTSTLWGSYDVLFKWMIENCPTCKICVIINDGSMKQVYTEALIDICKYYQIPYLDMTIWNNNVQPQGCFWCDDDASLNNEVRQARFESFDALNDNGSGGLQRHPSMKSHEMRSYAIQDFLERL